MTTQAATTSKQAQALLSKYLQLYKSHYNKLPTINRYKEKWAMVDVIDSIGYERAGEVLEYYFRVRRPGHPLQWFFYNFDRLNVVLKGLEKDEIDRADLKEQTQKRMEEWEQKVKQ